MKKKKKTTEKHYFARICRTLGRFSMCIGAVVALGLVLIYIAQMMQPQYVANPSNTTQQKILGDAIQGNIQHSVNHRVNAQPTFLQSIGTIFLAVAGVGVIALLFWRSLKHYNDFLRKIIAKIAKLARLPIFTVEICLTLLFWAFVTIFIAQSLPVFSVFAFFALVLNEFFFIFAWASYGRPAYTL